MKKIYANIAVCQFLRKLFVIRCRLLMFFYDLMLYACLKGYE